MGQRRLVQLADVVGSDASSLSGGLDRSGRRRLLWCPGVAGGTSPRLQKPLAVGHALVGLGFTGTYRKTYPFKTTSSP
ncbi:hypothetical protein CCP4SC76_750009 [Gammaproteobacteria bacterium]